MTRQINPEHPVPNRKDFSELKQLEFNVLERTGQEYRFSISRPDCGRAFLSFHNVRYGIESVDYSLSMVMDIPLFVISGNSEVLQLTEDEEKSIQKILHRIFNGNVAFTFNRFN